jgi:hypothetical protein
MFELEVVTITNTLFFSYGFLEKDFIVLCYSIFIFKT